MQIGGEQVKNIDFSEPAEPVHVWSGEGQAKLIRVLLMFALLIGCLMSRVHGSDISERTYSGQRKTSGDYTATIEEMNIRRLYVYGLIDEDTLSLMQNSAVLASTPNRLDAARVMYCLFGDTPVEECPFNDVPATYQDAVAWMYESGITNGIGKGEYGCSPVREDQFLIMIARYLKWNTEDVEQIKNALNCIYVYEVWDNQTSFNYGKMLSVLSELLFYARPDRCEPKHERVPTPKTIVICPSSYSDCEKQLKQALTFLPESVRVCFQEQTDPYETSQFYNSLATITDGRWKATYPLVVYTDILYWFPFAVEKVSDDEYVISSIQYAEYVETFVALKNWLEVFVDEDYQTALRNLYLQDISEAQYLTPYEKIKFCHDYVCRHARYDYAETAQREISGEIVNWGVHQIWGYLSTQSIVCDGYAKTFSWLLMSLGIDSYMVVGDTTNENRSSYGHGWSKVLHNGIWYNVDVCWDDFDNGFNWLYFLKSDDYYVDNYHVFTDSYSCSTFGSHQNCYLDT